MKCPYCNGKGEYTKVDSYGKYIVACGNFNGTGNTPKMTNEEWLRSATTEQLADVIADFYLLGFTHGHNKMDITSRTKWSEWLKQPHKGE